jgi:c-di-AMP phosphodiesterase-like protein
METDENALTHVKMASSYYSNEPNVSEDRLNNDAKESICEFIRNESGNREKTVLSPKRRKYDTTCSPQKRVIYSKFKVKLQKDLSDENLIMDQNSDNDDIPCDYGT